MGLSQIFFDEQGRLWVAVGWDGLWMWDKEEWHAFRPGEELPSGAICTRVAGGDRNEIWVSNRWQGLLHFNGTNWHAVHPGNSGLHSTIINDIKRDRNGRMWFRDLLGASSYAPDLPLEKPFELAAGQTLALYPNPVHCQYQVTWESGEPGPVHFRVYDVLGRLLQKHAVLDSPAGEQSIQLDRGPLIPGYYLLEVEWPDGRAVRPFVVK